MRTEYIPQREDERDRLTRLENRLSEIITQLRILNAYMAQGFGDEITEQDIEE